MRILIVFVMLIAWLIRWMVKQKRRRIREAYRFTPPKHGAAEWSNVDDVRKGGLL